MLLYLLLSQLGGLPRSNNGPFCHNDVPVRKPCGEVKALFYQQDREPALRFEAEDHVFDLIHHGWLDPFCRLIQQQDFWIGQQSPGNGQLLLLPPLNTPPGRSRI